MPYKLPPNAPKTGNEAFAYVGELRKGATIDDLKILAFVEAAGKPLYDEMAGDTDHPEIKELLQANGREELAHAHRVSKALEILTGEPFPIPPPEQNPFYAPREKRAVTKAFLEGLAQAEFGGQDLYAGIASSFDNPAAVALLEQNGKEEVGHGHRMKRAADLIPS